MYKRLKEVRKQLQLRQCDVAKSLYICTATYNRYEKGVLNLDATRLLQIADIYGVSVDYLLMRTNDPLVCKPETDEEIDFAAKYDNLDDAQKKIIQAVVKTMELTNRMQNIKQKKTN